MSPYALKRLGNTMKFILHIIAALTVLLAAENAAAQNYPNRPVRILVGFTPGTAPDVSARILAGKFSESWGVPVTIENLTGAGSNIATDRVAKSPPDGYTLLMGGNSALVISPSLYEKLPYDPIADFAPISQVFVAANILAIHPDVPAKTLQELVALARAQPGNLTYGHAGIGTSQHLAGELFKYMAHVDITSVAYRGSTAVLPDLLAGRLSIFFGNVVNVLPLVREGKLRAFAVTSLKRSAVAPELPTMAESGFPGFEAVPWFGLMAPAGTSPDIIDKIHRETVKDLALPDVRKTMGEQGLDIIGNSPKEFAAVIKSETPQWAKIIKDAGIKLSN
jgi:tripartite-type tricarboxylate transporter receptor subunit TctC